MKSRMLLVFCWVLVFAVCSFGPNTSSCGCFYAYTLDATGIVAVIDLRTNTVAAQIPVALSNSQGIGALAVSPDGAYVYAVGEATNTNLNVNVYIISTLTWTVVNQLSMGGGIGSSVTFTPDGKWAYVSNQYGNAVSVIQTATQSIVATLSIPVPSWTAASPDSKTVFVVSFADNGNPGSPNSTGRLYAIDVATNTVLPNFTQFTENPSAAVVSNGGTNVYVTSLGGHLFVVDAITLLVKSTLALGENLSNITVSPNGAFVLVSDLGFNPISARALFEVSTETVISTASVSIIFTAGESFSFPDAKSWYVADRNNGLVHQVKVSKNNLLVGNSISVGMAGVFGAVVSPLATVCH